MIRIRSAVWFTHFRRKIHKSQPGLAITQPANPNQTTRYQKLKNKIEEFPSKDKKMIDKHIEDKFYTLNILLKNLTFPDVVKFLDPVLKDINTFQVSYV